MAEKVYTPEAAAEALMVSPKTIREWLRTGKLGGVKVGRLWRVRESDLGAFLAGGQVAELTPRPGRCIAYTDTGEICGAPAAHLDPERGGLVCEVHKPKKRRGKPGKN